MCFAYPLQFFASYFIRSRYLANMNSRTGSDEKAHNEKHEPEGLRQDSAFAVHADKPAGRRKSVALNIKNPLKVHFFFLAKFALLEFILQQPLILSITQAKSPEVVVSEAKVYAESHGLSQLADLIGRAALVARGNPGFQNIPELSDEVRSLSWLAVW